MAFPWLLWMPHHSASLELEGKTVLITGASYGIGEATARHFAQAGATVLLLARSKDKLYQLQQEIAAQNGKAFVYTLDLAKPETIPVLLETILAKHPRIDIVLCNAGKSVRRLFDAATLYTDLEKLLRVNFSSHALLVAALLPHLLAQGGAQIINVSSVSVHLPPVPMWAAYQSTKTAFDVWLQAVGDELRGRGIYTTSVYFPLVRTRMSAQSKQFDHAPALSVENAASVLAYAVLRRPSRIAPWWLRLAEVAIVLFAAPVRVLMRHLFWVSKK